MSCILQLSSLPLICTHCHPFLFGLGDKKLPIFLQQPVNDDRGGDIVLRFEDTDLNIVSRWCTVEEYADVAGIRDLLALLLDLSFEAFDLLEMFFYIAVVIRHLYGVELSLELT